MKINVYKQYSKTKIVKSIFPLKVLKFKKTKWFKIRKGYKKKLKRKKFSNVNKIKIRFLSYKREKQHFRSNLKAKQLIYQHYKDSFNFKLFKKLLLKEKNKNNLKLNILLTIFLKIEYKIDIALFKLFFFSSSLEAKKFIQEGNILVNYKKTSQNYFLKQGDIVSINKSSTYSTRKILKQTKRTSFFHSFFEIDYYTKTFIVLKDFNSLSYSDVSLLLYEPANLLQIYRIITKK